MKALRPIAVYTTYYKQFGYSYHALGQLESMLKGKRKAQASSGLLHAMFLTEIESMVLTAGHDLTALRQPLQLKIAQGK